MSSFEEIHTEWVRSFRGLLPQSIKQLDWTTDQIRQQQIRLLRVTLAKAKACSPFYRTRLEGIDPEVAELSDLAEIPPLTKQEVMQNWDAISTDPDLTLAGVNAHLSALRDGSKTNPFYLNRYYVSATGGSSGRRGVFVWDQEHFAVNTAIAYRLEAKADQLRPPSLPKRTAVICAGSYLHASRMVFPNSADTEREIRVFPASTPLPAMIEQLNDYQPDRLVGYSSVIEELTVAAQNCQLTLELNRISTNSEPLTDEARDRAMAAWDLNIHNGWGSVEIGVAGIEGDHFDGILWRKTSWLLRLKTAQEGMLSKAQRRKSLSQDSSIALSH